MGRGKAVIHLWESATAVASTGSITSSPITQGRAMGVCSLLVVLTGSTPNVDISFTVGINEQATFYTPYNIVGTDLSSIYSALTTTTWIQFSPVLAPLMKIVVAGTASNGADTTAKATLTFEEEL